MGNEYGAPDLQPHLVYGMMQVIKLNHTGANTEEVIGAGYHQKMRLRTAYWLQVDAAETGGASAITVKHGANSAATGSVGAADPIGKATEMTIVDQYKDADGDNRIVVDSDGAGTTGDLLIFLLYELVE